MTHAQRAKDFKKKWLLSETDCGDAIDSIVFDLLSELDFLEKNPPEDVYRTGEVWAYKKALSAVKALLVEGK